MAMKDLMKKLDVEKFLEQKDWLETLLPHNELAAGLLDFLNEVQLAAEKEYHVNFLPKTDEVTELCPHCDREVTLKWNVNKDGLKTFCPYCGKMLMLCAYCPATYNERPCDYKDDSCFYSKTDQKNTAIYYQYRDASNYKVLNSIIVPGVFSKEQEERIWNSLLDMEYFLPQILGFPYEKYTGSDDDHPYFELLSFERTTHASTIAMDPKSIVQQFEKYASHWEEFAADYE